MDRISCEGLEGKISDNTQVIWLADREADIYEFIDTIIVKNQDFVIRANCNRVVLGEDNLLKDCIRSAPVAGVEKLKLKNTEIEVEISFCDVELLSQRRKGGAKSSYKTSDHEVNM